MRNAQHPTRSAERGALTAALALGLLLCWSTARAQGRFTPPLPAAELPDGVITVKVVGKGMSDIKVGQAVTLISGSTVVKTERTGENGRAQFEGLQAGHTYILVGAGRSAGSQGSAPRSQAFGAPAKGGLRFLLFQQAQVSSMTGGSRKPSSGKMPSGHPPLSGTAPQQPSDDGAAEVKEAKDLAPGVVVVQVVKGRGKTPVAGAKVVVVTRGQIQVVKGHPVVAPTQGRRLITDKQGKAQLSLSPSKKDSEEPQVFMVVHAKLTYRSRGIVPSPDHGHRVTFQVYDLTNSTTALKLRPGIQLLSRVAEGSVSFMQIVSFSNTGDAIVHLGAKGLRLPLPRGATSLEVHQVYKDLVHVDSDRGELYLLTPIPPGAQEVRYFYELPFKGAELDLTMEMQVASEAGRASVLGQGKVALMGPAVTGNKTHSMPGSAGQKQQVYLLAPVAAGGVLELTFTGLPHGGKDKIVAAVITLSCVIALWAIFAGLAGARSTRAREARKEQLLDQLARLEGVKGKDRSRGHKARLMRELKEIWEAES